MSDRHAVPLAALLGPGEPELTCEACFEQLDRYVELERAGGDADGAVAGHARPPAGCPACREDHDSLLALVGTEAADIRDRGREPRRREGGGDAARGGLRRPASCSSATEAERPYERPPLSKEYLRGELERDRIHVHAEASTPSTTSSCGSGATVVVWTRRRRGRARRRRAAALRPAAARHGRRAAPAPDPGAELDGVRTLRTCGLRRAARAARPRAASVVVVGAGWIGCEVAASARQRGLDVTVSSRRPLPLERVLGRRARRDLPRHPPSHGVGCCWGPASRRSRAPAGRARAHGRGARDRLRLRGRRRRRAAAHGSPSGPGLDVDDGILVDERLETSARPASSRPATSPTRATPSTASASASSTGRTRSPGAGRGRSMLGGREPYDAAAVLLLRPVRRRDGVHRARARPGPRRLPRRSREPRVHRLLAARGRASSRA